MSEENRSDTHEDNILRTSSIATWIAFVWAVLASFALIVLAISVVRLNDEVDESGGVSDLNTASLEGTDLAIAEALVALEERISSVEQCTRAIESALPTGPGRFGILGC